MPGGKRADQLVLGISDKTVHFTGFSIVFSIENTCKGVFKRNVLGRSLQHVLIFCIFDLSRMFQVRLLLPDARFA